MMGAEANTALVRDIMIEFADQTGISTSRNPPRRYLWTDAHAVCNFLSLYHRTGEEVYKRLALTLIDQVHNILGKHREDDPRCGWISGLSDNDGEEHPTAGGLRIGKKVNERGAEDAFDERLEWDRDGQYYHYLTKWMHALARASMTTGKSQYCRWAMELAKAAHAGFTRALLPGGEKRLLWKMSIDLSYPLVPSTGLHDPLDGYITYNELGLCAKRFQEDAKLPDLDAEIAETNAMNAGRHWETDDALGMGGLLFDACRVCQLTAAAHLKNPVILEVLIRAAKSSIDSFAGQLPFLYPAEHRLAFRELGLSIGLRAVAKMRGVAENNPDLFQNSLKQALDDLQDHAPLGEVIEDFWRKPGNQQVSGWLDHRDINSVMLATSLLPDEFLSLF